MDRALLVLVGLSIFLFCTDIFNIFTPKPPKTTTHYPLLDADDPHQADPQLEQLLQEPLKFPTHQKSNGFGGVGIGSTINIDFCTSCSYRGTAITLKNMLVTSFPGIDVILANHHPPLPRRLLSKLVPVVQVGIIGTIMAGKHVFSRLGITTPPPWYQTLQANRFGSMASTWLLGNFIQSFLQSTGAFEVYCNGELVFSKLKEQTFPSETEMRDLVGKKLGGGVWP